MRRPRDAPALARSSSVAFDLERIVASYHEHGFLDARIVRSDVKPRARDGGVDMVITVGEAQPR